MSEMTETSNAPEAGLAENVPDVDELQGRLADLQGAMDLLQSGDLDGAEATIAALEASMVGDAASTAPEIVLDEEE